MRIISLHVSSFGKLKNLDLNFNGGVNVLQQRNGYGKTTLANFIRAMLYGFEYKRAKRGAGSTDAALWARWNSTEKTGGSMVVEHLGVTYRIERYFGLTAKSETLNVINVATGKTVNMQNVGEFLLGLTAESYDRSAYFPQEAVEIYSNENFDSRLAGLVQNDENYDDVQDKLRKFRKELKYERGEGGLISELDRNKSALQRKIYDCGQAALREQTIESRLREITAERERAQDAAQKYNAELLHANTARQPDPNTLKLQELQNKLARCSELENDKLACDALASKIESAPNVAKKQRGVHIPLLVVALVLAAAGVAMCFWILAVGICALVAGVALSVVSFFLRPRLTTLPAGEKDAYITEYFNIAAKYFYCKDMDYAQVQKAMWQTYNDYLGDKRQCEYLQKTAQNSAAATTDIRLQQLRNKLAEIQTLQQDLSREEGRLIEERKSLFTDATVLREQLEETEQKLRQAKHSYEVAEKTSELLARAKENLSVMYLPRLCERCKELLCKITAGDYRPVIDRTFAIKLQTEGVVKPLDNFSRGIREITLLCFRIALSEILFDGAIPFLIIDDAFVNFDEENFVRATKLLQELKSAQILYLTCLDRLGKLK